MAGSDAAWAEGTGVAWYTVQADLDLLEGWWEATQASCSHLSAQ